MTRAASRQFHTAGLRFLLVFLLVPAAAATAQTPDPVQLLRGAALFGSFDTLQARIRMEIFERRGSKERELAAYLDRRGGQPKALVQIVSPAFLNTMKFLSIGSGPAREQWLATSRGVRRIVASGRSNERVFDSDFTIEDLSDYDPDDYSLSVTGQATKAGERAWILEAVSVHQGGGRKVLYLSEANGLMLAADFYSAAGVLERQFELLERMSLNGVPFPRSARMTTLAAGTHTVVTVLDAQSGMDIPERIFSRGNL